MSVVHVGKCTYVIRVHATREFTICYAFLNVLKENDTYNRHFLSFMIVGRVKNLLLNIVNALLVIINLLFCILYRREEVAIYFNNASNKFLLIAN